MRPYKKRQPVGGCKRVLSRVPENPSEKAFVGDWSGRTNGQYGHKKPRTAFSDDLSAFEALSNERLPGVPECQGGHDARARMV